jgi:hypothetical protein
MAKNSSSTSSSSSSSQQQSSFITSTPDVLCVFGSHEDGPTEYYSTEFHLQFPKKQLTINLFGLESSSTSSSSSSSTLPPFPSSSSSSSPDDIYHMTITCNGTHCTNILTMYNPITQRIEFIENSGEATTTPSSDILKNFCFIHGQNFLLFENKYYQTHVECLVYLWSIFDKIVVVDIDGTLTRSDVRGYVETVYLGRYEYIHDGAVTFFSLLSKEFHVCHLYLTSRPLHHLQDTKAFLHLVHDHKGNHLPKGPLFTNKENVMKAIYRELVAKTSAQFKGSVLVEILSLFVSAGAMESPFCLGVGNKETDALAYRMASMNASRIFLVQTNSTIVVTVASRNHQQSQSQSQREQGQGQREQGQGQRQGQGQGEEEENVQGPSSRTELRFQNYADPSLWQYVKLKMMRNHPSTSQRSDPIPKELGERQSSSRTRDNSLPAPLSLSRAKSDHSYEATRETTDGHPPPPVNFHGTLTSSSQSSLGAGTGSNKREIRNLGKKKLEGMTDFFNPVDSADI